MYRSARAAFEQVYTGMFAAAPRFTSRRASCWTGISASGTNACRRESQRKLAGVLCGWKKENLLVAHSIK